jgi:hypothetical protein
MYVMCSVRVMVFNATVSIISIISWRSVLLVEKTGVLGEIYQTAAYHWQILSHSVVSYTSPWAGFELTTILNSQLSLWWYLNNVGSRTPRHEFSERVRRYGKLYWYKIQMNVLLKCAFYITEYNFLFVLTK